MFDRSTRHRRSWCLLRWSGLAIAVPAVWACNSHSLEAPIIKPTMTFENAFQETGNRKIDILFMIDNSSSMVPSQTNIKNNLPMFMNVLKGLKEGLPDLHVAVVTSDMGAGNGDIMNCDATGGDNGIFRSSPTGSCTATNLQAGATFIADTGGSSPQTNFSGDISDVFQCIAVVGDKGCGEEHQLAAVARALGADGQPPPPQNAGFLRPEAYLGIVFITNEDDCSAPQGSPLFDTSTTRNLASTYGPLSSYVCNEFGHRCGNPAMTPPRLSPNPADLATTVTLDDCVSAEGEGMLHDVSGPGGYAAMIKALKQDPASQILVASIQGPVTPYTVHWSTPPTSDGPWPSMVHSCDGGPSVGYADPGVRMQQFVKEFGNTGLVYSICEQDFAPALTTIAMAITKFIGPKCITGQVATRAGSPTPDCTVTDVAPDGKGGTIQQVVPACADVSNAPPCWSLTSAGGMNCPANSQVVTIDRGGALPPDNQRNLVQCAMCVAGYPDASRGCP